MRRTRQSAIFLLTVLAVSAYFAHHAIYGRYGLEARSTLTERLIVARGKLTGLEAIRGELARDVTLLAPVEPDPDLVEELARANLGFSYPGDRVLIRTDIGSVR